MKPYACLLCASWIAAGAFPADAAQQAPEIREASITIDDLPAAAATNLQGDAKTILAMTEKLLNVLRQQHIPAVGFVNEQKLYKWGEVDDRIKALSMWLDAGFELGNHTFSHPSLNQVGVPEFEDNVIQGEAVLKLLLAQHKMKLRYFRHPFLDSGRDLKSRLDVDAFLVARGYRIAPVTLDAWDWMYARVYDDAKARGDAALEQAVISSYLSYTETVLAFDEKFSKDLFGFEPKQIMLLHGNQLNADHLNEVLEMMRKRGYHFITLENALSDDVYSLPDTYIGEEGTGWLDHWAITRGIIRKGYPKVPSDIADHYELLTKPH
jgi:peptidoglycan/xylan/chitin deacetylase (PgdA/CDA1 family)